MHRYIDNTVHGLSDLRFTGTQESLGCLMHSCSSAGRCKAQLRCGSSPVGRRSGATPVLTEYCLGYNLPRKTRSQQVIGAALIALSLYGKNMPWHEGAGPNILVRRILEKLADLSPQESMLLRDVEPMPDPDDGGRPQPPSPLAKVGILISNIHILLFLYHIIWSVLPVLIQSFTVGRGGRCLFAFVSVSSDISQLLLASVTTISERRSSGCHHTKGEEPKMNLSRLTVNDPTTETAP
ncbi:hypothetical protein TRIUR3_30797 [Triticum urartu]|uniref:Uncharacterized protein n=1 Tax=Triticum urartu TaxID=4572 RepID=M7Y6U2_TRIUA|nr:hypothetical protein TRIUR3_30797 [Triticum urartu]